MSAASDYVTKVIAVHDGVEGVDDNGATVVVRVRYEEMSSFLQRRLANLGGYLQERFGVFLVTRPVGYTVVPGLPNLVYTLGITAPPAPGILPEPDPLVDPNVAVL